MRYLVICIHFIFFQFALANISVACDPNESCNRCLLSTFGHCIKHGNDPVCELRKKACQVAPPVVNTPGSPFGPGGLLQKGGPMGLSMPQVYNCIGNISRCPAEILSRIGYETVRPIVDHYIGFLQNQAGNRVRPLPDSLIDQIQPYYSVNLHNVRYATGINTIHGQNITIGNNIYFVKNMVFSDPNDAWTLYHELEHVVQYSNRGGVEPFLIEYILKSSGSILRGGNSIDMHDNIDLERAANAKANQVASSIPSQNDNSQYSATVDDDQMQGSVCRSSVTVCLLPGVAPVGAGCYCGTPYGQASGVVSQN